MITLANGHSFSVCAASGALAYGRGWWFDRWLYGPLGWIKPGRVTVITKTLTTEPTRGNLRMWAPWRSVRPNFWSGNCVNAVGLTNPGWEWWCRDGIRQCDVKNRNRLIVSVRPDTKAEAAWMAIDAFEQCVSGLEFNASCPNVHSPPANRVQWVVSLFDELARYGESLPVGVKLGCTDDWVDICKALDGRAAWFTLINAVPWNSIYTRQSSPLARYRHKQSGAVSGPLIRYHARSTLLGAQNLGLKTPIISGGGIMSSGEAFWRLDHGASAVALGTVYLTRPWRVNRIINAVQEYEKCKANS